MASKPTKLGEWASGASRTLEPSSGEKTTGWQAGYKPPARKANWLHNIAYQWFQYLSDAIFAADSGTNNDGLNATGDGTGDGVVGTGGASNGSGVIGTGIGTGDGVKGVAGGTAGSYGVHGQAVSDAYAGVYGTGGTTDAPGVFGVAGQGGPAIDTAGVYGRGYAAQPGVKGVGVPAGNGPGVVGTGTGTGTGIEGSSSTGIGVHGNVTNGIGVKGQSINQYGVVAQSDTSSPAKSALRVVPQNAEASSSPAAGDIQVNSVSGKLINHNGSAFERQIPQNHAILSDETETSYTTETGFATSKHTIPAGTLQAGSTIRVKATGEITTNGTNHWLAVRFYDGTNSFYVRSGTPTGTGYFAFDVALTVRSSGAGGDAAVGGAAIVPGAYAPALRTAAGSSLDTTQAVEVELRGFASTNSTARLEQFIVDVT